MSDIVRRLRERALVLDEIPSVEKLVREAADEIERLRIELGNARQLARSVTPGPSFADIKQNKDVLILDGTRGE